MEKYVAEYLGHIGIENDNYKHEMVKCEICDSKEFTIIRDVISLGKNTYGKLPIQACDKCGHIMQNPRFERRFYQDFYRIYYRQMIKGSALPSQDLIDDQIFRAENLLNYLKPYFPKSGSMLDVGCGVGGFLIPFQESGWETYGTDPDKDYVNHGKDVLKLPVDYMDAEDMVLEDDKYDLIIIMGSLEHVFDPNIILEKCRKASKKDAILVLEGRFSLLGFSRDFFNHNHHRYLRKNAIELIMIKHGWKPFITTEDPICGDTRAGNGYCIGRTCDIPEKNELLSIIENGQRVDPKEIIFELDGADEKLSNNERK